MSKAEPDYVALFLDIAEGAVHTALCFSKPAGNELIAAIRIQKLLPHVRAWIDGLNQSDRAGLAMAILVAQQAEIIDAGTRNLHADAAIGRRVAHRGTRKPPPRKVDHDKIVKYASKLLKDGVPPHKVVGLTHAAVSSRSAISKRHIRTILESKGLVRPRKVK